MLSLLTQTLSFSIAVPPAAEHISVKVSPLVEAKVGMLMPAIAVAMTTATIVKAIATSLFQKTSSTTSRIQVFTPVASFLTLAIS